MQINDWFVYYSIHIHMMTLPALFLFIYSIASFGMIRQYAALVVERLVVERFNWGRSSSRERWSPSSCWSCRSTCVGSVCGERAWWEMIKYLDHRHSKEHSFSSLTIKVTLDITACWTQDVRTMRKRAPINPRTFDRYVCPDRASEEPQLTVRVP